MTNEMKLLRAFIEASGYEVEDTQKVFIKGVEQKGCGSLIPIDADNIDYLEVVNDYKVTKRKVFDYKRHDEKVNLKIKLDAPLCKKPDEFDYMSQIKRIIVESGIPKSVILDLIGGIYD